MSFAISLLPGASYFNLYYDAEPLVHVEQTTENRPLTVSGGKPE